MFSLENLKMRQDSTKSHMILFHFEILNSVNSQMITTSVTPAMVFQKGKNHPVNGKLWKRFGLRKVKFKMFFPDSIVCYARVVFLFY